MWAFLFLGCRGRGAPSDKGVLSRLAPAAQLVRPAPRLPALTTVATRAGKSPKWGSRLARHDRSRPV